MKYSFSILLIILMSACCGTNSVAENPDKKDATDMPKVKKVIPEQLSEDNLPVSEKQEVSNDTIIEQDVPPVIEKVEIKETVSEEFDHSAWDKLLKKHVSNNGNVDYQGFKQHEKELNRYLNSLSDNAPESSWSEKEILAYWINVYNAFTVKLILQNHPIRSIKDINGPWNYRFIRAGSKWYTLNDVEHRIIRKMNEPRIHFALVCAAISCPRLYNKAFTAKNLEDDLNMLTREFLNDTSKNIITENSIQLSKIFKWYGGDFRKNGNTLNGFLSEYTGIDISPNAKKSFLDYNWALNE